MTFYDMILWGSGEGLLSVEGNSSGVQALTMQVVIRVHFLVSVGSTKG